MSGRHRHSRPGFTLLELVIVVAILAILSTLAVVSLNGVDDQSRFDQTRGSLREIDEAVLGAVREGGGAGPTVMAGFVGDVGRLPLAVGTDPKFQLQELWLNPRGLTAFGMHTSPVDPEVVLESGWRSGYLRPGFNSNALLDGWGNAFDMLKEDGTPAQADEAISAVRSRGADNAVDGGPTTGNNADSLVVFGTPAVKRYAAAVSGSVFQYDNASSQLINPGSTVIVLCFLPDGTTGGLTTQQATINVVNGTVTYSFAAIPIGPRVVRAYLTNSVPLILTDTSMKKSIPVRLTLQPGGQTKDLVLH